MVWSILEIDRKIARPFYVVQRQINEKLANNTLFRIIVLLVRNEFLFYIAQKYDIIFTD